MSKTNLVDPDVVVESDQEVIDVPDDSASQSAGNVCRTPKPVREIQAILQREEDLLNMQCVRRKVSGLKRMAKCELRMVAKGSNVDHFLRKWAGMAANAAIHMYQCRISLMCFVEMHPVKQEI